MDGAGHWQTLVSLYLPLSKPVLATLTLFVAVHHWNSWFDGLIFMNSPTKYPLQSYLQLRRQSPTSPRFPPGAAGHVGRRGRQEQQGGHDLLGGGSHNRAVSVPAEVLYQGHRARQRQGLTDGAGCPRAVFPPAFSERHGRKAEGAGPVTSRSS